MEAIRLSVKFLLVTIGVVANFADDTRANWNLFKSESK